MKKNDLKQLIKPLVKECIHEVLIEEGLLSNVVAEVAKGMQGNLVTEAKQVASEPQYDPEQQRASKTKDANRKLNEHRAKLLGAINSDAYNGVDLFEGTSPMTSYEAKEPSGGSVDLGNPSDPGVDISSLMGGASKLWKAMK